MTSRLPTRPAGWHSDLDRFDPAKMSPIPVKYFGTVHFEHARHKPYSITGYSIHRKD